ncbi:uncharacterized protein LOC144798280 isoform X4 [Lissotriton helveticus]
MPCWQDADLCRRGVIKVHSQESSRPVFLGQREQVHSQESSRPVFLGQREQTTSLIKATKYEKDYFTNQGNEIRKGWNQRSLYTQLEQQHRWNQRSLYTQLEQHRWNQ